MTTTNTTARVYIASLSDYNAGSLLGEWFDLEDYSSADELLEAIGEMLKGCDAKYGTAENFGVAREEWAAHDWEGVPNGLTSEHPDFDTVLAYVTAMNEAQDAEAFASWYENETRTETESSELLEAFTESYCGQHGGSWPTEERALADYAEELTRECQEIPDFLSNYIDWEAMGRDMRINGEVWADENGHVFRNI